MAKSEVDGDVRCVYTTAEAADKAKLNATYMMRLAKSMKGAGELDDSEMRATGIRGYLFSESAVRKIKGAKKGQQRTE